MTRPRRAGGAASLIQNSEITNNAPSAAENTNRTGNHHQKLNSSLKPTSDSAASAIDSHRNGSTPMRAASQGTKGMVTRLASPATAVLMPISVLETPIRSISSESSGIE